MLTSFYRGSGVGDFGPKGIESFLRDHRCKHLCKILGLHRDSADADDADESETESEKDAAGVHEL
jgi:hypothetical protein